MTDTRRVAITSDQIDLVVHAFYTRVRQHPELGPIFHGSIGTHPKTWDLHEAKIGNFWRNALLREPVYSGNPMMVHAGIPQVEPHHFPIWLAIFDEILAETLPAATAQSWSRLAHRIGQGTVHGAWRGPGASNRHP